MHCKLLVADYRDFNYGNVKQKILVEGFCEKELRNQLNFWNYSDQNESSTFTKENYQNAAE